MAFQCHFWSIVAKLWATMHIFEKNVTLIKKKINFDKAKMSNKVDEKNKTILVSPSLDIIFIHCVWTHILKWRGEISMLKLLLGSWPEPHSGTLVGWNMSAAHAHRGSSERAKIKSERERDEGGNCIESGARCSNFALQGNPLCIERVNLFLQRAVHATGRLPAMQSFRLALRNTHNIAPRLVLRARPQQQTNNCERGCDMQNSIICYNIIMWRVAQGENQQVSLSM
jgi:hypothetical protein